MKQLRMSECPSRIFSAFYIIARKASSYTTTVLIIFHGVIWSY